MSGHGQATSLASRAELLYKQNEFEKLITLIEPTLFDKELWSNEAEADKVLVLYLKSLSEMEHQSKTITITGSLKKIIPPSNRRAPLILDFYKASALIVLQSYDESQRLYHHIIDNGSVLEPDLDSLIVKSYANIAVSHHLEGEWLKAEEYYKKTISLIEHKPSRGHYNETMATLSANYLNLLFDNLGRYHDAEKLLSKVMNMESNNEIAHYNHHLFIIAAEYYLVIGRQDKFRNIADALEKYYTTRKTVPEGDLGYLYLRKAIYNANIGNNTRAAMLAQKAEMLLADKEGMFNYLPDVYDLLITSHILKGERHAAIHYINKLIEANKQSERYELYYTYIVAARHYAALKLTSEAICYADSGAAAFKTISRPTPRETESYHTEMGWLYYVLNDKAKFRHHLLKLRDYYKNAGKSQRQKELEVEVGLIYCNIETQKPEETIKKLNSIRNGLDSIQRETRYLITDVLDRHYVISDLNTLAAVAWLNQSRITNSPSALDSAWVYHQLAVKEHERRLNTLKLDEDRITVSNEINHYLMTGYNIARQQYVQKPNNDSFNRLISVSQRIKSYSLNTELTKRRNMTEAGVDEGLINSIENLQEENMFLSSSIANADAATPNTATTMLLNRQRQVLNELEKKYSLISVKYPRLNDISTRGILKVDDIQQRITTETAILDYCIYRGECTIIIIKKNSYKAVTIPWGESEALQLRSLIAEINKPFLGVDTHSYQNFIAPATACYSKLIEPVKDYIKGCKLTIIPHKELSELPFEVLTNRADDNDSFKNTDYLIRNHQISYATTLSMIPNYNSKAKKVDNITAFTPDYAPKANSAGINQQLRPLPWAAKEMEMISEEWPMETFESISATKDNFLNIDKNRSVIHLAMHAIINNDAPMQSSLIFTDEQANYQPLKAFEIYTLQLSSPLIVLNACNTGVGSHINGEGSLNLTRAFQYAGAASVINTQWPVNDQTGAKIIGLFYRYLSQGLRKDEALAKAKTEFLAQADNITSHPYYWACHTITGDTTSLYTINKWHLTAKWVAGMVVLYILAHTLLRLKRRERKSVFNQP